MEFKDSPPLTSVVKCCDCDCVCNSSMETTHSATCVQAVNRKYDEIQEENCVKVEGVVVPQNARVEIGNECTALREMVISQQQTIEDLVIELEEERNAASTAANEALSMILRLQKDKAEIQMELRQFKRFAEEKMAHDQQEALGLEDMVYKREEAIQSLTCEIEAYRHKMMSCGLTEAEVDGVVQAMSRNHSMIEDLDGQFDEMYPPLKCNVKAYPIGDYDILDVEKHPFGETPHSCDELKDLNCRINQLEISPRAMYPDGELVNSKYVLEKVVVGHSPKAVSGRNLSTDGTISPYAMAKEKGPGSSRYYSPRYPSSFKKTVFSYIEENPRKSDNASEYGDEMSDRVYTIDSVHQANSKAFFDMGGDEYIGTPRDSPKARDLEIQKLYARLQFLEADRESMRQAIISMGTEKAQVVLLKEIAQNLCKEMSPTTTPVKKKPETGRFTIKSIFKWIVPIFAWRRRGRRCRYMFGLSTNNIGLLVVLDRSPRVGLSRRQLITNM